MENTPLISVVIPVYNAESTIRIAAQSILGQPNSELIEILLVDDGSTDNSGHLCDELSNAYPNIKVFHKSNGGVSSARNLGITFATGKYLAFLDSDDWWEATFLTNEIVADLLKDDSSDLYCFSYQKVSPSKKWVKPLRIENQIYKYDTPSYSHCIGQHHSAFFYKASYLNRLGFRYLPTKVWEDVPFTQLCCTFAKSIVCIDKVIFSYWMNAGSCMHTKNSIEKFNEHYKAEHYAQTIYNSNGVQYDLDRIIISLIGESLKSISAENTYSFVKQLITREEFDLLKSNIQPWGYLQKDIHLWRKKPFLAYLKNRISVSPLLFIKKALLSKSVTRPVAEYLQYRAIEKWSVCDG